MMLGIGLDFGVGVHLTSVVERVCRALGLHVLQMLELKALC